MTRSVAILLLGALVACGADGVSPSGETETGTDTDAPPPSSTSLTVTTGETPPPDDSSSSDGSDGSDGSDDGPPVGEGPDLEVVFPPAGSRAVRSTLTVRGTASDDDGVTDVQVSGVGATSDDDFATWVAVVPLSGGPTALVVTATDGEGNEGSTELEIDHRPILHGASDLVWDGAEAFIVDTEANAVLSLDADSGIVGVLSDDASTADDPLDEPVVAALIDESDDLLVVDGSTLQRVDKTTGSRVTLASAGDAPSFTAPVGLAVEVGFGRAVVVDAATGNVVAVDLDSGAKSVISTPADGAFFGTVGAVAYHGWDLFVVGAEDSRVVVVDTTNGSRSTLSVGGSLGTVGGATTDRFANHLIVGGQNELRVLDIETGAVEPFMFGSSIDFFFDPRVTGLAFDTDQELLLGVDSEGEVFTASAEDDWAPTILSGPHHPSPELPVSYLGAAAVFGDRLLAPMCEYDLPGFLEIDLATGERRHYPGFPGDCRKVAKCGDSICFANSQTRELEAIDPDTGDSTVILDDLQVEPSWSQEIAFDESRNAIMLADTSALIERVDVDTGAREFFSDDFSVFCGMTVDEERDDLLLIDFNQLWRIPLAGGLSEAVHTFDPPIACTWGSRITIGWEDADTVWVANRDEGAMHVVDLVAGEGTTFDLGPVRLLNSFVHEAPEHAWMVAGIEYPTGLLALDRESKDFVVLSR